MLSVRNDAIMINLKEVGVEQVVIILALVLLIPVAVILIKFLSDGGNKSNGRKRNPKH